MPINFQVIYFDKSTGVTSLLMHRCAEGTTYLNIPAKAENISFHNDINSAVEARASPLPKISFLRRWAQQDLTDKGLTETF